MMTGQPDHLAADVVEEEAYLLDLIDRVDETVTSGTGSSDADQQLAWDACLAARRFLVGEKEPPRPPMTDVLDSAPEEEARGYLTALGRVSAAVRKLRPFLVVSPTTDGTAVRSAIEPTCALLTGLEELVEAYRDLLLRRPGELERQARDSFDRMEEELESLKFRAWQEPPADDRVFGRLLIDEAARERCLARRLWIAAVALVAAIVGLSFATLYGTLGHADPVEDLTKLVVTLPLAALAAFMGRESARHRQAAERLWGIGMPLAHIRELAGFDLADRKRLTEDLMMRVPVPPPNSAGPDTPEDAAANGPTVLGELSGVLANLPDVIKAVRGG